MTSRLSFSKQFNEEIKHHLVSVFVVVLVFLIRVLLFHFEVQDNMFGNQQTAEYLRESLASMAEPQIMPMIPVIMLAMFMSAEYFSYLHSRRKSDFYMSLPIKRKDQFLMGALVCGYIFAVPCIVATVGECIIAFASGYGSMLFLEKMLWKFICTILIFAAVWLTMALAMIVTGNIIVALLGFGAFSSYIPIFIRWLVPTYQSLFYETYVEIRNMTELWYYFSPIGLATGLAGRYYNWELKEHFSYLIGILLYIAVIGVLTVVLYQRRPSEAAGKAMAFEKINSIIRFLIVLPLALYCGYFLSQMTMTNSKLWLIIGTIFGAALLHGIMESIFAFDLHAMLSKKKQLGLTIVISLGVIFCFQMNTENFNSYIPEENEVENVIVEISQDGINFYQSEITPNEQKGVTGENIKVVLALAENMVRQQDENVSRDQKETIAAKAIYEQAVEVESSENTWGMITLEYQMQNGLRKAREYYVDLAKAENRALLDIVFATEDFKDDYYVFYSWEKEKVTEMTLDYMLKSEKLRFTDEEKAEFIEIYLQELSELSYTEMLEQDRIAALTVKYYTEQEEQYYIYDSFEKTISFLNEYGIDLKKPFSECEILSVEFSDAEWETIEIDNLELLKEIKTKFLLEDYYSGRDYMYGIPNTLYASAEILIDGKLDTKSILIRPSEESLLRESAK